MSVLGFWAWTGWNALVAIGTLALAGVTALLAGFTLKAVRESRDAIELQARETTAVENQTAALADQTRAVKSQAEATERQVRISAASLEAAARPVLVAYVHERTRAPRGPRGAELWEIVPYSSDHSQNVDHFLPHYEENEDWIYCSLPVVNVGQGVAFVQSVGLLTRTTYPGRISNTVIPPGDRARARFAVRRKGGDRKPTDVNQVASSSGSGITRFTVYLVYTGASRNLITASEITVSQVPTDREFIVTEQKLYDSDATKRNLLVSTENIG